MKHLTSSMLALCFGAVCTAQEQTFTLHGRLQNSNPQQKLLVFQQSNEGFQIDTIPLDQGRFHYRGNCQGTERRILMLLDLQEQAAQKAKSKGKPIIMYGSFDLSLFVSPRSDIEITGDVKTYPIVNVKDSLNPMNEDYATVRQLYATQQLEINRLHQTTNEARWLDDTVTVKNNEKQMAKLHAEITSIRQQWLKGHPANEYAAYLYTTGFMHDASVNELEAQYALFSPTVQNSIYGQQIADKIQAKKRIMTGNQAPAFTLTDVSSGKPVSLADYRGRYLILDFWGSWCHPCRASHPHLLNIHDTYKDKGLAILGVAADRKKEVILKAARQDKLPWTQTSMYEQRPGQEPINKLYNVSAFPTKFLISPEGVIKAIYVGDSKQLDEELARLLKD